MKEFLPPPVTPSDEEPIAAGGWQGNLAGAGRRVNRHPFSPPPVLPSDEEPMATGGR